ncbi:MAG: TRAP transporter substrate-binding protein [Candidatus Accumulibacter sp.]|nr:TRAP transporter substrate-binding protein [Accumulibacter sp.]MCB1964890.1 TRAP transporter substrate-binding protein [Accumulibacter sp.]
MTVCKLLLGVVACVFSALPRAALAEDPIVIKFSHVVAPDTPKGMGAEFFAKRASELTRGRVKVEVYPNSTLYKDKEELEALQLGAVQMVAPSLAKFGLLGVREFELYDLPYIFDSYADLHRVTRGPIGQSLFRKLEPKGLRGLAYWDNGFKSFSANTPILMPDDLKGKKMRIQPSKVIEAQMRALEAIPRVMAFSEVYQALQIGIVDGTENPISNLYSQKMFEVQSHLALTEHGYLGYAVIVDRKFWEGLPADVRGQLEEAMSDATDYTNRIAKEENDKDLDSLRKTGKTAIHVPTPEQRRAFKKALIPVHAEMASRIGKDLLESVYKETGFDPGRL